MLDVHVFGFWTHNSVGKWKKNIWQEKSEKADLQKSWNWHISEDVSQVPNGFLKGKYRNQENVF